MTTTCHFQKKPDYYASKEECQEKEWESIQTNPRYKDFDQTHFTAGDLEQFESYRNMVKLKDKKDKNLSLNLFNNVQLNIPDWEKYKNLTCKSVDNTFNYLFHKFKKGIFVQFKDSKLSVFLPFSNRHFINEWSHKIAIDPKFNTSGSGNALGVLNNFIEYVQLKGGHKFNPKGVNKQFDTWYSNNCLVRYEYPLKERDTNISIVSDMLSTLAKERELPDFEFFVNRRDFPLLKLNSTEPYEEMFDDDNLPLLSHNYSTYSPIFSMVGNSAFADIPIPTPDDWSRIGRKEGKYFPDTCTRCFEMKSELDWENKINKAVFRGSSTGIGTTIENNPRLKLCMLAMKNKDLDAGITSWNVRPRKIKGEKYLKTIEIEKMPFSLVKPLTPSQQANYKYIIHIQGHVEAFRLSLELESKCCILLVESKYKLWYSHLLKPYEHYVPVKSDLSDLENILEWCKQNDGKCKKIAYQAYTFSQTYLTKKGILDHLQQLFWQVKKMNGNYIYYNLDIRNILTKYQSENLKNLKIKKEKPLKQLQPFSRTFGFLKGIEYILSCNEVKKEKEIFSNTNTRIYKGSILNYPVVVKYSCATSANCMNLTHEAFVGLNCLNELAKDVPNFVYTFKYNKDRIIMEYIEGITLLEYIHSSSFNMNDFENILKQLGNALSLAQKRFGFVHNDLTPWNIILRKGTLIPVIIDMGRAHVIHDNQHFCMVKDLEFVFDPNQDMYMLLVTTLWEILNHELNSYELSKVMNLGRLLGNFEKVKDLKNFLYKIKNYSTLLYYPKKEIKWISEKIDFLSFLGPNPMQVFEFAHASSIEEQKQSFENVVNRIKSCSSKVPRHLYLLVQKTLENNDKEYEKIFKMKMETKIKLDIVDFKYSLPNIESKTLKIEDFKPEKNNFYIENIEDIEIDLKTLINLANLGSLAYINNQLYLSHNY